MNLNLTETGLGFLFPSMLCLDTQKGRVNVKVKCYKMFFFLFFCFV